MGIRPNQGPKSVDRKKNPPKSPYQNLSSKESRCKVPIPKKSSGRKLQTQYRSSHLSVIEYSPWNLILQGYKNAPQHFFRDLPGFKIISNWEREEWNTIRKEHCIFSYKDLFDTQVSELGGYEYKPWKKKKAWSWMGFELTHDLWGAMLCLCSFLFSFLWLNNDVKQTSTRHRSLISTKMAFCL